MKPRPNDFTGTQGYNEIPYCYMTDLETYLFLAHFNPAMSRARGSNCRPVSYRNA
jgi:hypothetical protein